ncbi:MAG TPA: FkbM family methyltransferase [Candidatus Paceibacterota bacterium]
MIKLLKQYKIKDLFAYAFFVPKIIFYLDNWLQYLKSYNSSYSGVIRFRNGLKLKVKDSADTSSISVIFFKREYGVIKENSTVLDIGANRGYFSVYAANSVKHVKVYSFEPIKATYDSILENIQINNLKEKIIPFNLGVAGSDNVMEFSIGSSVNSSISNSMIFNKSHDRVEKIKCICLKSIIENNNLSKIDLIKMDCEGAEFEILLNTPADFLENIHEIRMEYHNIDDKKLNIENLKIFLQENGYKVIKQIPSTESVGIIWFKQNG